jgi:GntR family transcriptional regulator
MSDLPPNRPGRQPLYAQVRALILTAIETGEWLPGEALPSEFELAARYQVSQGTVRKGLDALVADGVLQRRQGVGTFVAEVEDDWGALLSPEGGKPMPVTLELLACGRVNANDAVADRLGLRRAAPLLVVRRLLRAGGMAVGVCDSFAAAERFDAVDARRVRAAGCNLRRLWWREFGVRVVAVTASMRAVPAERDDARILGCEAGLPMLEASRLAADSAGVPVEWSVLRVRAECWAYRP